MSRVTQYICDGCNKPTGNKAHITLMLNGGSGTGVASPRVPTKLDGIHVNWQTKQFGKNFIHFHDGDCAKKFFDKALKDATDKK